MKKFFIPHKLAIGDITHLADNDSIFAISHDIKEEEYVEIQSPSGVFLSQITFVQPKSVELEIVSLIEKSEQSGLRINVLQSVSNITKFGFFLEKITELGVTNIYPIISEYCIPDKKTLEKDFKIWNKIIDDASEQSRNYNPPTIFKAKDIKEIEKLELSGSKLCFATENVKSVPFTNKLVSEEEINLAFGPESGWSIGDIAVLKQNNFQFVNLKGNILRTETTPIVVCSIIKFIHQEL